MTKEQVETMIQEKFQPLHNQIKAMNRIHCEQLDSSLNGLTLAMVKLIYWSIKLS